LDLGSEGLLSRLTELISRVERKDPELAAELAAQIKTLTDRREFGLNFERHIPESVELPGRKIRRGDKVRVRLPRGTAGEVVDERLWIVSRLGKADGVRTAQLIEYNAGREPVSTTRAVDNLVVVAEFRDPIYPGLRSTGKVERGGNKPFHAVINAENYHALEALRFAHEGKVDCIYIDPPYNTRDKDWKYNNDYVDSDDAYRHSKWLAMLERRLKIAKELLNPVDSVLIATIDEREYLRLGLLLEQTFPHARIQMVSSNINPASASRAGGFGRSDEYIFFVMLGRCSPSRVALSRDWVTSKGRTYTGTARWDLLRRSGSEASRTDRPGCFYPVYVDMTKPAIVRVGDPLPAGESIPPAIDGALPVLPIRKNGSEGRWMVGPEELRTRIEQGRVRVSVSRSRQNCVLYYLADGEYEKVRRSEYQVDGHRPDGSMVIGEGDVEEIVAVPSTQWRIASHDATQYGSRLLSLFLPDRRFPFPKSLYAVEDTLRFFVGEKPEALVLDFFSGSGTTAHAVARLNKQDSGRRRSICITNNEVGHDEAMGLMRRGLRPGDLEWEALGICEYITKPRIRAAITGRTPDGEPIKGDYKFTDEFPMADGFDENVEFFDLTYEDPDSVRHDMSFAAIAPLLWMKAGSQGHRIDKPGDYFDIAETYAVLFNVDASGPFLKQVAGTEGVGYAFIVTDDESQYQLICEQLPDGIEPVRLYESYLRSAELNAGKE
jgi:adenine-specific DNA-methyltransferase